mmetsp:Transcript_19297/g.18442  ORF Transcript_19297/g.18442 Transcript_19297/m.18442 type:complete len:112 (+) Transcript_19297:449-784(+)
MYLLNLKLFSLDLVGYTEVSFTDICPCKENRMQLAYSSWKRDGVKFVDFNERYHFLYTGEEYFKDKIVSSIINFQKNKYCLGFIKFKHEVIGLLDRENKSSKVVCFPLVDY